MNRTRVLIADDSALMRKLLTDILNADPEIEVVGAVSDAFKAREQIKKLDPDVLTLDIEMPKMDGISFLEKLMRLRPMPVVMISAMTQKGADITMKALMLGALDFISKPKMDIEANLSTYSDLIRSKVKTAGASRLGRKRSQGASNKDEKPVEGRIEAAEYDLIAIGASTGGVEAIHNLLARLPVDLPPIVITQHIPPVFSASFARRLNDQLPLAVYEVKDGQPLKHGEVYVAPGDQHFLIENKDGKLTARVKGGQPVNRHMPAVDVLFESVAREVGVKAIGVLLTGMGDDGARELLHMRQAGAVTIAQDRESSVVWGMPREAIELGAARHVLHLGKISGKLLSLCASSREQGEPRGNVGPQARTAG